MNGYYLKKVNRIVKEEKKEGGDGQREGKREKDH